MGAEAVKGDVMGRRGGTEWECGGGKRSKKKRYRADQTCANLVP